MKRIVICTVLLITVLTGVAIFYGLLRSDSSGGKGYDGFNGSIEESLMSSSIEESSDTKLRAIDMMALKEKCHKGYYRNKVRAMWDADAVVSDNPLSGMVEEEVALRSARDCEWLKAREYDEQRLPGIVLVEDVYVVTFWKKTNPFVQFSRAYALQLEVSAWNGEVITGAVPGGGMKKIVWKGDGLDSSEMPTAAAREQGNTMAKILGALDDAATEQGSIPETMGEASGNVVAPLAAIVEAEKQAVDRQYDRDADPTVSLVGDVYVVTFWKPNPDDLSPGTKRYDSRVLINAETGEYLKMEIGGALR